MQTNRLVTHETQTRQPALPGARRLALGAGCLAALMLSGCAGDHRFDHPGPPHPGAVNPYSNGGFSDPGPNYPATGH